MDAASPRQTRMLIRGAYDKPGEAVEPGVPAVLPELTKNASKNNGRVVAHQRQIAALEEVLGKAYSGTIVSDFFSAYVKYANRLQPFCLAHLIRDIKFLATLPDEADKQFGERLLIDF